jgi:UDP-glucose 4-epimerase
MKKYLVTGGAGFIGGHLVNSLTESGNRVVVVDNLSNSSYPTQKNIEFLQADVSDKLQKKAIMQAMSDCDGVFHMAALAKVQDSILHPEEYNKNNVDGTLNILNWSKEVGVKRVVFSSSSSIYGDTKTFPTDEDEWPNPMSPYALQKLIGEQYCKIFNYCYGLETVCLRYFNVFGEGQTADGPYSSVISIFKEQKSKGLHLTIVGNGNQTRDFVYVGDVAKANILAMESKEPVVGECINIGSGKETSVNEIADLIGGEKTFIEKRLEPSISLADNTKAKQLLNWEPSTSVQDWLSKNI